MHGLIDYTETEITREELIKRMKDLLIPFEKNDSPDFRLSLLESYMEMKFRLQEAFEIIKSPVSKLEDVQLFQWHGHASEKKVLDDRAGYLIKVKGVTVLRKLTLVS